MRVSLLKQNVVLALILLQIQQAATTILKDVEDDSELRIRAYLALVESPSPKVADIIKELVDSEPINQG